MFPNNDVKISIKFYMILATLNEQFSKSVEKFYAVLPVIDTDKHLYSYFNIQMYVRASAHANSSKI